MSSQAPVTPRSGSCFCGAVQIEVTGEPVEMGYCHCSSCRTYSGAPLGAFVLFREDHVRVTHGSEFVGTFNKSGPSERRFCTRCGGHLMMFHPGLGLTDVRAAVLPTIPFEPSVHLNYLEAVLPVKDGLPKLRDFPAHAGGSGELLPD